MGSRCYLLVPVCVFVYTTLAQSTDYFLCAIIHVYADCRGLWRHTRDAVPSIKIRFAKFISLFGCLCVRAWVCALALAVDRIINKRNVRWKNISILFSAFFLLFDFVVVFLLFIPSFCRLPSAHFLGTQALESNKWHIGNGIFSYFIFPSKFSCCSGYLGEWVRWRRRTVGFTMYAAPSTEKHIEFARQSSLSKHGTHGKFVSLAEERTEIGMIKPNENMRYTQVLFAHFSFNCMPSHVAIVTCVVCWLYLHDKRWSNTDFSVTACRHCRRRRRFECRLRAVAATAFFIRNKR